MPAPEIADLYQRAVLWPLPAGAAGFDRHGRPTKVGTAIEIACRWIDGDYEALDKNGNTITLNAKVIVGMPAIVAGKLGVSTIVPQSRMWLGKLADWNNLGSPSDTRVMEVKTVDRAPDLKNRFIRFRLGLMRYSNKPTG